MKNVIYLLLVCSHQLISQGGMSYEVNGVFNLYHNNYYTDSSSPLVQNESAAVFFSQNSTTQIEMQNGDYGGIVQYNQENVPYTQPGSFYVKTMMETSTDRHWQVSGNGNIPALNFTYNGPMPNFEVDPGFICDTLDLTDSLLFTFNNLQFADSIMIEFMDENSGTIGNRRAFVCPNISNEYWVKPIVFGSLQVGLKAIITVHAINYSYQTIAGKQFLFRNVYCFAKSRIPIVQ